MLKKKNCVLAKEARKIFFKIFVVTVNSTATGGEGWVSILTTAKRAGDFSHNSLSNRWTHQGKKRNHADNVNNLFYQTDLTAIKNAHKAVDKTDSLPGSG